MSRHKRLGVWLVSAFLFIGAFAFALLRFDPPTRGDSARDETPVQPQTVVEEGAEVVLRYVLEHGGETGVEVIRASEDLIGRSIGEVEALRPTWRIRSFARDRIVADVPCEPEGDGGFLGEKEGNVAIFDGDRTGCYRLREVTGLSVDRLHPDTREALQEGIPFAPDDLPQLLEGLQGEM